MRIVAFVKGLFGLVDSLESGRGLSELSETMAATVEVGDLLGLNRLKEETNVSFTGTSATPIFAHTVPNDKVWRLRAWSVYMSTSAGNSGLAMHIGVKLANLSGINERIAGLCDGANILASSFLTLSAKNLPLLLPPGANLCVFGSQPAGAVNLSSHVVYEEFDA